MRDRGKRRRDVYASFAVRVRLLVAALGVLAAACGEPVSEHARRRAQPRCFAMATTGRTTPERIRRSSGSRDGGWDMHGVALVEQHADDERSLPRQRKRLRRMGVRPHPAKLVRRAVRGADQHGAVDQRLHPSRRNGLSNVRGRLLLGRRSRRARLRPRQRRSAYRHAATRDQGRDRRRARVRRRRSLRDDGWHRRHRRGRVFSTRMRPLRPSIVAPRSCSWSRDSATVTARTTATCSSASTTSMTRRVAGATPGHRSSGAAPTKSWR